MMDTTVAALKNLYAALGGTAADVADVKLIPDMINAIAVVAEAAAAKELPTVSGSDNGNVLTVVGGKWAKAAAPVELPAVTADDNGDVLTVVEGAWAKAAAPVELPAVTADDNGDVLTVVEGEWNKAALPAQN